MNPELVAPCGMNCSLCSNYLARTHGIPRARGRIHHCTGCRIRHKRCAYLFGNCRLLAEDKVRFCFECEGFPCRRLRQIDKRYRTNYGISFIENLEMIRDHGMTAFLREQKAHHSCDRCGDWICVHNKKCYACDPVTRWRE